MGFTLTGTGSFEYEFELNAYRISQLLEHTEAFFSLSLSSGMLKNSKFQKRLNEYFTGNELMNFDFNEVVFQNFTISVTQRGENFFIGNFLLNGEKAGFNAYGRYNYLDGADITLQAIVRDKEDKSVTIPFRITGPLLRPELLLKTKKDAKPLILFQVD